MNTWYTKQPLNKLCQRCVTAKTLLRSLYKVVSLYNNGH